MKYIGKVMFNMSETEFWKTTPREMLALIDVHCQINDPEKKKEQPTAFIDQIM